MLGKFTTNMNDLRSDLQRRVKIFHLRLLNVYELSGINPAKVTVAAKVYLKISM